jgi:hypothetical protein
VGMVLTFSLLCIDLVHLNVSTNILKEIMFEDNVFFVCDLR